MNKVVSSIAILSVSLILSLNMYAGEKEKPAAGTSASTTITGKVIDKESGEALTGVAIELGNSGEIAYSDFDGNFSFSHVLPAEYKLTATYVSYEVKETLVTPNNNNRENVDVKLEMISKE